MSYSNSDLATAFPLSFSADALQVVSVLPEPSLSSKTFSVYLTGETLCIPYRIYHDPALIDRTRLTVGQAGLLDCLLTRHHNGFVRERHLARIISANNEWIPAFVVQLVGEYVVEILQVVCKNLDRLEPALYRRFLQANPKFFALTRQRVISYWDCYYRRQRRADYVGFKIIAFLEHLLSNA